MKGMILLSVRILCTWKPVHEERLPFVFLLVSFDCILPCWDLYISLEIEFLLEHTCIWCAHGSSPFLGSA